MKRGLMKRHDNGLSDGLPVLDEDARIAQHVKHRAAFDAFAGFPLRIECQAHEVRRNAADPRWATEIDFWCIAIIDDTRNELNHVSLPIIAMRLPPLPPIACH